MGDYLDEAMKQAKARARIRSKLDKQTRQVTPLATTPELPPPPGFFPIAPTTYEAAGLDAAFVHALILKHLAENPGRTGQQISQSLAIPRQPTDARLQEMKLRKQVVHRGATATGDFVYDLAEEGIRRARLLQDQARYAAEAPVPLEHYLESVHAQSLSGVVPTAADLNLALEDLEIDEAMKRRLGPALASREGLFLYGPPGNGKTSIAKRLNASFSGHVFIPRYVLAHGSLLRIFDPLVHEEASDPLDAARRLDPRWVRCRRPCVVSGGELTLDALDIQFDPQLGVSEAPLQLKANSGTLVLDDFGRQRVSATDLLNRWIVPMEQRVDYLRLPGGKSIEVPFDTFVIFSTNLDPADLVDEAFLRRIPYKVHVGDPDEATFRRLLAYHAAHHQLQMEDHAIDYLIETHFQDRPMRFCHPRDLIRQIRDRCAFTEEDPVVSPSALDEAVNTFFARL